MLEPRQMNEDGLDVREANHRMMNMLAILLALFHRNFSKFSDQCVRGAVRVASPPGKGVRLVQWYYISSETAQ
ncbi:MAG: hypothetical protein WBW81_05070 [Methylocella sp.]